MMQRYGRWAGVAAIGLVAAVSMSGCSMADWERAGLLEPVTDDAETVLGFWQGSWITAMAVGILVWGLMIWAFIAYRRRSDSEVPRQIKYHLPIETLWTVAPLIMVVGIFYFAQKDETSITSVSDDAAQTINVVGFRWSWTFNYQTENTYETGEPAYLPNARQGGADSPVPPDYEAAVPTLWLPVNQKVRFELTSPDVIHSFWVTNFLYKLDVVPGRTNVFETTPNKLGTYAGKCAELCGVDHSRMLFQVKIVTPAEFDAHMDDLRKRGLTGQLLTGRTSDNAQAV